MPLYCCVLSIAITSRMVSTTQIISCFRIEFAQIEQMSASATLKHRWQNLISLLIRATTSLKFLTNDSSCFNKCSTSRSAVFFPIPGNLENSFTAFSNRELENCMTQRYGVRLKAQGTRYNKAQGTRRTQAPGVDWRIIKFQGRLKICP